MSDKSKVDEVKKNPVVGVEKKNRQESPNEKFVRLAKRRVNKLVHLIGGVRNLANRRVYGYTDEQSARLIAYIEGHVAEMAASFRDLSTVDRQGFSL